MKTILTLIFSAMVAFSAAKSGVMPEEIYGEQLADDFDEYEHAVFSVEAVNVSLGYPISPVEVEIDGTKNGAEIFLGLFEEYGLEAVYSGSSDEGFYLADLGGFDTQGAAIPESLKIFLEQNDIKIKDGNPPEGFLGEFDMTEASGWIYTVNGEMPSFSLSDYIPEAGDVVRLRYSLCYGADTARYDEWGYDYGELETADTEEVTRLAAECGFDLNGAIDFDTTQDDVNRLADELKSLKSVNP